MAPGDIEEPAEHELTQFGEVRARARNEVVVEHDEGRGRDGIHQRVPTGAEADILRQRQERRAAAFAQRAALAACGRVVSYQDGKGTAAMDGLEQPLQQDRAQEGLDADGDVGLAGHAIRLSCAA